MSRRQQGNTGAGCGVMALLVFGLLLLAEPETRVVGVIVVALVVFIRVFPIIRTWREKRAEEELERAAEASRLQHVESLLRRDAVGDEINYMSGSEFERFMADVFRQKGYDVQETRATGDQGVDLLLDLDEKKVAVQLKRWTGPVGNKAIQATFAGMAHYNADEGWIITTSTFTRSARELARSTRVRLIDGKELGDWLEGLREQE